MAGACGLTASPILLCNLRHREWNGLSFEVDGASGDGGRSGPGTPSKCQPGFYAASSYVQGEMIEACSAQLPVSISSPKESEGQAAE